MYKLNRDQVKQLAEFSSNLGLVFAASVISPLFSNRNIDMQDFLIVVLGLELTILSLVLSLFLLSLIKERKK